MGGQRSLDALVTLLCTLVPQDTLFATDDRELPLVLTGETSCTTVPIGEGMDKVAMQFLSFVCSQLGSGAHCACLCVSASCLFVAAVWLL
jgi:hypothetical protein